MDERWLTTGPGPDGTLAAYRVEDDLEEDELDEDDLDEEEWDEEDDDWDDWDDEDDDEEWEEEWDDEDDDLALRALRRRREDDED